MEVFDYTSNNIAVVPNSGLREEYDDEFKKMQPRWYKKLRDGRAGWLIPSFQRDKLTNWMQSKNITSKEVPISKPKSKHAPASKVVSKPASKATPRVASKVVSKPASKATPRVASNVVSKATSKPASKATSKVVSKPASKVVSRVASKPASKAAPRPVSKPASKVVSKAAARVVSKRPIIIDEDDEPLSKPEDVDRRHMYEDVELRRSAERYRKKEVIDDDDKALVNSSDESSEDESDESDESDELNVPEVEVPVVFDREKMRANRQHIWDDYHRRAARGEYMENVPFPEPPSDDEYDRLLYGSDDDDIEAIEKAADIKRNTHYQYTKPQQVESNSESRRRSSRRSSRRKPQMVEYDPTSRRESPRYHSRKSSRRKSRRRSSSRESRHYQSRRKSRPRSSSRESRHRSGRRESRHRSNSRNRRESSRRKSRMKSNSLRTPSRRRTSRASNKSSSYRSSYAQERPRLDRGVYRSPSKTQLNPSDTDEYLDDEEFDQEHLRTAESMQGRYRRARSPHRRLNVNVDPGSEDVRSLAMKLRKVIDHVKN